MKKTNLQITLELKDQLAAARTEIARLNFFLANQKDQVEHLGIELANAKRENAELEVKLKSQQMAKSFQLSQAELDELAQLRHDFAQAKAANQAMNAENERLLQDNIDMLNHLDTIMGFVEQHSHDIDRAKETLSARITSLFN